MPEQNLKVVVGLGKSGLSCVKYLLAKGERVAVTDSRLNPPGLDELRQHYPNVRVATGSFDEQLMSQASELIISPGVSLKEPAIAKLTSSIPIIGDIELFARATTKPIIAITGSNGKSTVTSLVGHLAQAAGIKTQVGGNLGTPALDLLVDTAELYVLELSSFQLETTHSLKTLAAVNLNISPDHLDRYANLQEYIQAKQRIYQGCQNPVINWDDPSSYQGSQFMAGPIGFTLNEPQADQFGLRMLKGETYLAYGKNNILATRELQLKGKHQYANVLAAFALGLKAGLTIKAMVQQVTTFSGLPHRCQWVATIDAVDWYNDSKATNIGSTQAAIIGIGPEIRGKLVLLAGGQGKNADFSMLYGPVAQYVKTLILYGEDKQIIAKNLSGAAPVIITDDLKSAIDVAKGIAIAGDVVILCPACASYDMFENFEHRGEVFMTLVRELAN